jgi:hypothetical protein
VTKILGYYFEIIYKKGKQNVLVDALSRKDEVVEAFLCAISIIQPDWIIEVRDEWKNDRNMWTLIQIPVHQIHLLGKMMLAANPIFFYYSQKAAYTPCRITTSHCRIVLIDIRLIFATITIQFRLSFHNCKCENTSFVD